MHRTSCPVEGGHASHVFLSLIISSKLFVCENGELGCRGSYITPPPPPIFPFAKDWKHTNCLLPPICLPGHAMSNPADCTVYLSWRRIVETAIKASLYMQRQRTRQRPGGMKSTRSVCVCARLRACWGGEDRYLIYQVAWRCRNAGFVQCCSPSAINCHSQPSFSPFSTPYASWRHFYAMVLSGVRCTLTP